MLGIAWRVSYFAFVVNLGCSHWWSIYICVLLWQHSCYDVILRYLFLSISNRQSNVNTVLTAADTLWQTRTLYTRLQNENDKDPFMLWNLNILRRCDFCFNFLSIPREEDFVCVCFVCLLIMRKTPTIKCKQFLFVFVSSPINLRCSYRCHYNGSRS